MDIAVLPIDIPFLVAVALGGLTLLIPVAGLTVRFALKPLVEALSLHRARQGESQEMQLLERRVSLIEQQMQSIDNNLERLVEKAEFDRQLSG